MNGIIDAGAIPVLLRHLQAPEPVKDDDDVSKSYEHGVEKGCAFVLGLLAVKVISY